MNLENQKGNRDLIIECFGVFWMIHCFRSLMNLQLVVRQDRVVPGRIVPCYTHDFEAFLDVHCCWMFDDDDVWGCPATVVGAPLQ